MNEELQLVRLPSRIGYGIRAEGPQILLILSHPIGPKSRACVVDLILMLMFIFDVLAIVVIASFPCY